jgi:hypothetical protein
VSPPARENAHVEGVLTVEEDYGEMPTPGVIVGVIGVIVLLVGIFIAPGWCAGGGYELVLIGIAVIFFGLAATLSGLIYGVIGALGIATVIFIVALVSLAANSCIAV